jgi:predicted Zn-dependent protease
LGGLFYSLGRRVGPKVRKAKWMWLSATGSDADAIAIEYHVGQDLANEIRSQLDYGREPQCDRMLNQIGQRLAHCVANKLRRFSFETIKGPEPNAFALPGGFVFVTKSLVDLCQSDPDEIAFILGHEMAHVVRGHAMNRIVSNSAINIASRVGPGRGPLSNWLRHVGVQFLESAYSRDMETEADRLGVRLVAAAGFDPQGGAKLFARLAKLGAPGGQTNLGKYFSSHPSFEARIHTVNRTSGK